MVRASLCGNFLAMARLARTVVAGLPHHVTQRGNRREAIFFEDGGQYVYRDLLAEQTRKAGVEVVVRCQTPPVASFRCGEFHLEKPSPPSASIMEQFLSDTLSVCRGSLRISQFRLQSRK